MNKDITYCANTDCIYKYKCSLFKTGKDTNGEEFWFTSYQPSSCPKSLEFIDDKSYIDDLLNTKWRLLEVEIIYPDKEKTLTRYGERHNFNSKRTKDIFELLKYIKKDIVLNHSYFNNLNDDIIGFNLTRKVDKNDPAYDWTIILRGVPIK